MVPNVQVYEECEDDEIVIAPPVVNSYKYAGPAYQEPEPLVFSPIDFDSIAAEFETPKQQSPFSAPAASAPAQQQPAGQAPTRQQPATQAPATQAPSQQTQATQTPSQQPGATQTSSVQQKCRTEPRSYRVEPEQITMPPPANTGYYATSGYYKTEEERQREEAAEELEEVMEEEYVIVEQPVVIERPVLVNKQEYERAQEARREQDFGYIEPVMYETEPRAPGSNRYIVDEDFVNYENDQNKPYVITNPYAQEITYYGNDPNTERIEYTDPQSTEYQNAYYGWYDSDIQKYNEIQQPSSGSSSGSQDSGATYNSVNSGSSGSSYSSSSGDTRTEESPTAGPSY
jgi:hypothetical protein